MWVPHRKRPTPHLTVHISMSEQTACVQAMEIRQPPKESSPVHGNKRIDRVPQRNRHRLQVMQEWPWMPHVPGDTESSSATLAPVPVFDEKHALKSFLS
eukprot:37897-Chlamydomonas_euryale.AAC.12